MAALAEICNPPVDLPPSLWHMFAAGVNKDPGALAFTVCHQSTDHLENLVPKRDRNHSKGCLSWTYHEMSHAALLLSKSMLDARAKTGGTVLSLCPNGIEAVLGLWASAFLQMTYVPLDPGLLEAPRRDELKYYLQKMNPSALVIADSAGAKVVDQVLKEIDIKSSARFVFESPCEQGWRVCANIAPSDEDLISIPNLQEDPSIEKSGGRTAVVLFTSKTSTSKPKGCPLSVRNVVHACEAEMALAELPSSYYLHTVIFCAIATV